MVVALLIVSGLYYSVRCQRLGRDLSVIVYLNVTGIGSNLYSLLVHLGSKFSIKPSCLSVQSFSFKILLVLPITFTESSNCMGVNTLVMLLAKVEKKRYEAYLDQMEREEKVGTLVSSCKSLETQAFIFSQINCIRFGRYICIVE
ncbi:MAG: hypothetical protein ACLUAO_01190 [Streptococcus sp.]